MRKTLSGRFTVDLEQMREFVGETMLASGCGKRLYGKMRDGKCWYEVYSGSHQVLSTSGLSEAVEKFNSIPNA